MKTKIINNVEFETETHDFNKKLSDIKIPEGWRLWTYIEAVNNYNNHKEELNLEDDWFFIEQFIEANKGEYVAWLDADSAGAYLDADVDSSYADPSLGVRFCRDVECGVDGQLCKTCKGCSKKITRGAYTFNCGEISSNGNIQLCKECKDVDVHSRTGDVNNSVPEKTEQNPLNVLSDELNKFWELAVDWLGEAPNEKSNLVLRDCLEYPFKDKLKEFLEMTEQAVLKKLRGGK